MKSKGYGEKVGASHGLSMHQDVPDLFLRSDLDELGRGHDVFIAIGRRLSWCLLRSVPVASAAATVGTCLAGINPIWTLLFAVLAIVFLHGCLRVRSDEARLRREYFQQIIQRRQS